MAMEEAERGEPLSHAYKAAYADLLVDLEVKDAMAGKVERVIAPEGGDSILKKPSHLAWGCLSVPRDRLGLSGYYPLGPQGLFDPPSGQRALGTERQPEGKVPFDHAGP